MWSSPGFDIGSLSVLTIDFPLDRYSGSMGCLIIAVLIIPRFISLFKSGHGHDCYDIRFWIGNSFLKLNENKTTIVMQCF